MPTCVACGTERAPRWFFFKSSTGVVATCSHTCRELYLAALDGAEEEARATVRLPARYDPFSAGSEPETDSPPH